MGNLVNKKQEQELVADLIVQSNGTLQEEKVYETIMKSNCKLYSDSAKELQSLFLMFKDLDANKRSYLSNREMLNLPEFKYHPFRFRLKYALQTKGENYIKDINRSLGLPGLKDRRTAQQRRGESRHSGTIPPASIIDSSDDDSLDEHFFNDDDRIPYIDFQLFCIYLSPFCQRTPIDIKVNFLFLLFDFDQDGAVSKQDLIDSINNLVGTNLSVKEIKDTVDNIFDEIGEDKDSLDKEDFQKVLWVTDFDQKLNISRFSET